MAGYFITGTDTGIGKTWITVGLMTALKNLPARVVGMKPVASGCVSSPAGLRNEDALLIQAQCTLDVTYNQVNPYAFAHPVAPHLAAAEVGTSIDLNRIIESYNVLSGIADAVVVEGVGGWRVPLGDSKNLKSLVQALNIPVILVVGLKLGCINHALLTVEAIIKDEQQLVAWVANQVDPDYEMLGPTLDHLIAEIPAPMIGHVPFMEQRKPDTIAASLDLTLLGT